MRPSVGPSGCLPHGCRPESAAGLRPVAARVLHYARPGLLEHGLRPRPRACRRATCGRDGSGSASRCAFADARPPWLASLSTRPRWRGARCRASAAVRDPSKDTKRRRASCAFRHQLRSLEAPRKANPARQAGGLRRISRASPVIRRQARRVRPGRAHRPRAQGGALRSARRVACRTAAGPSPPQAPRPVEAEVRLRTRRLRLRIPMCSLTARSGVSAPQ